MKKAIWALALILMSASLHAQITATTADGRTVILLEDGTWKFDTTVVAKKSPKPMKKRKKGDVGPTNPALGAIQCSDITMNTTDPQTGQEVMALTNTIEVKEDGRNKMTIGLSANKDKTLFWNINLIGQQGCKNRTPKVKIDFTDGSKMQLDVANDFICDNNITLYLGKKLGKKDELLRLRNKTIKSITILNQGGGESTTALAAEQANVLQKAFICLANN
jgi:hypothetical protein